MLERLNQNSFWSREATEVFKDLADVAASGGQHRCADFFGDVIRETAENQDYEAQITEKKEENEKLNNQLDTLQAKFDAQKDEVDARNDELEVENKELKAELEEAKKAPPNTQALQNEIKHLKNQLAVAENEAAKAKL